MEDIVLQYTYPRLDAEVSKHRNHLLKAPFCVHPKTGRICVPLDPASIDEFDPERVPTVGQLLQELDAMTRSDDQVKEYSSGMWLSFTRVVGHQLIHGWIGRLGEDFFETLYRFIRQACLVVNGGSEEGEAQNR